MDDYIDKFHELCLMHVDESDCIIINCYRELRLEIRRLMVMLFMQDRPMVPMGRPAKPSPINPDQFIGPSPSTRPLVYIYSVLIRVVLVVYVF